MEVLAAVSLPHPVVGRRAQLLYKVKLNGPAGLLRLRFYSRAMVLVDHFEAPGNWQAGWNQVRVPIGNLGPGTWFCVVDAEENGRQSLHHPPGRLVILP